MAADSYGIGTDLWVSGSNLLDLALLQAEAGQHRLLRGRVGVLGFVHSTYACEPTSHQGDYILAHVRLRRHV